MKLFLGLALSLILCSTVMADNLIVCPASLTCNYDTGKCDMPTGQWVLDAGSAMEPFSGPLTMNISKIWAYKQGDEYQFECTYQYGNNSQISIYTYVKSLIGENWVYSGFGQQQANCSQPTAPNTCAGQN
jgi:hypothetical protein